MSKFCLGCMEQYEEEYEVCPHCGYVEGTPAEGALHMDPGSVLKDRYIIGRVLGYGGFGVTYIGWDGLLEQKVAVKEYLPSEFATRSAGVTQVSIFTGDKEQQFHDGMNKFIEEARKLANFSHTEGIVRIFDSFEENNTAYIVMEYLEGETLAEYLKRMKTVEPELAVAILEPVIRSLQTVHEKGIIHRDIAPDNIMLTVEGKAKLIDFGAARYATTAHSRSLTVLIKPGYSPEEQYRSRGDQGPHTDVYAMGATLYRMITGETPPDAMERRALYENKGKDTLKPVSQYCKDIDENLENAILNAMNVRIEDRTPTMEVFLQELNSEEPVQRIQGKIRRIDPLHWPLWAKIGVPGAAAVLFLLCTLFFTGVIGYNAHLQRDILIPEGMSRVPSVVNDELKEADERLDNAMLLYSITGKEYSDQVPADLILSQDVAGGAVVMHNTMLQLMVSGGPEMGTVPDVEGLELEEAVSLLEEAGFLVETEEEYSSVIAEGSIITQSEEADSELALGSTIILTVSKGIDPDKKQEKKETTVPDFVGKTYKEAGKLAEKAGLVLSVKEKRYSTEYAADVIMEQGTKAKSKAMTGDTVELVVSLGKEVIKVADVQYQTEKEAIDILEKQGLTVATSYEESETVAAGLVIRQSITAGKEADPGTKITLTISKGASGFAMEDVTGKSEEKAKSTLGDQGLSVTVAYEYSDTVSAGTVIRQTPSGGTQVTRGTAVTITVSSGEETVTVPNVVGKDQSSAKSAVTSAGLAVSVTEVYDTATAKGTVMYQTPSAGTGQKKGTTVVLTVSKGKEPVQEASKSNNNTAGNTNTSTSSTKQSDTGKKTQTSSTPSTSSTTASTGKTEKETKAEPTTAARQQEKETQKVPAVLSSVSVKTKPGKTSYYVGDTLDTSGLTLTASYSDGKIETISNGYSCSPTSLNSAGTQKITVTYGEKSTSFDVTVAEVSLSSISVQTNPNKMSYYVGDTLDTSGLTLIASYSNGKTETINDGYSCSPTSLNNEGTQKIEVTYKNKNASFDVQISMPSLSFNTIYETLYIGDSFTINYTKQPFDMNMEWSSDNNAIATVDNGTITAHSKGTALITGIGAYNGVYSQMQCSVEILEPRIEMYTTLLSRDESLSVISYSAKTWPNDLEVKYDVIVSKSFNCIIRNPENGIVIVEIQSKAYDFQFIVQGEMEYAGKKYYSRDIWGGGDIEPDSDTYERRTIPSVK